MAHLFREETLIGFQKDILGRGWGVGGVLLAASSPRALRESHSCSGERVGAQIRQLNLALVAGRQIPDLVLGPMEGNQIQGR